MNIFQNIKKLLKFILISLVLSGCSLNYVMANNKTGLTAYTPIMLNEPLSIDFSIVRAGLDPADPHAVRSMLNRHQSYTTFIKSNTEFDAGFSYISIIDGKTIAVNEQLVVAVDYTRSKLETYEKLQLILGVSVKVKFVLTARQKTNMAELSSPAKISVAYNENKIYGTIHVQITGIDSNLISTFMPKLSLEIKEGTVESIMEQAGRLIELVDNEYISGIHPHILGYIPLVELDNNDIINEILQATETAPDKKIQERVDKDIKENLKSFKPEELNQYCITIEAIDLFDDTNGDEVKLEVFQLKEKKSIVLATSDIYPFEKDSNSNQVTFNRQLPKDPTKYRINFYVRRMFKHKWYYTMHSLDLQAGKDEIDASYNGWFSNRKYRVTFKKNNEENCKGIKTKKLK